MRISHTLDNDDIMEIIIDNQEKRNAIDDEMISYLVEHINKNSRLTVIRSVGKYFCSGRDIGNINFDDDTSMQPLEDLALAFRRSLQPILAVVEGPAIGLGVSIACWSDLCLASTEAKFVIPESKIGIAPTITASSLIEAIGRKRCLDMCLTAREVAAAEAYEYGIVQYVCAAESIHKTKTDISNRILHGAPEAISMSKSLIRDFYEEEFNKNLQLATRQALLSARSATAMEGLKAFREKKKPSWISKERQ